jgi:hypothetical protein
MSEQQPYEPESNQTPPPPQQPSQPQSPQDWREARQEARAEWREARREWREERRAERYSGGGAWVFGVMLILIGVLVLLSNAGLFSLRNWWALFILIPAAGSFTAAFNQFKAAGRLTAGARSSLIGGFIITMVAAMFLIGLNWGLLWPVLLILAGVGALLNAFLPA